MASRPGIHAAPPAAGRAVPLGPDSDRTAHDALTTFAFLWAAAVLFHYSAWTGGLVPPDVIVLLPAAIAVLLRPRSLVLFLIMVGLQIATILVIYPDRVPNHWIFAFFVNVTILIALARVWRADGRVTPGRLFAEFAPVVRIEVVIIYFFAVFHKFNADFFDPDVSCATELYTNIAGTWHLPTWGWLLAFAPVATVIIEAAIPLLLFFRRTRVWGVLLGLLFHFILALDLKNSFYDFSAFAYAAYFLFIPYDYYGRLRDHWAGSGPGRRVAAWHASGALRTALVALLVSILGVVAFSTVYQVLVGTSPFMGIAGSRRALLILNTVLWTLYAVPIIFIFLRAARADRVVEAVRGIDGLSFRSLGLAVVPLFMIFNGFNPYLGLKTEDSFAMFSNLQTEGGSNNHLFMTTAFQIGDFQNDLVQVLDTSDRALMQKTKQGYLIPYFEFRRRMLRRPGASVTYVRGGQTYTVPRVGDDPVLSEPLPLLLDKWLQFRLVDTNTDGVRCIH